MDHIQKIGDALKNQQRDREPWTSGTIELEGSDLHLYFTCKDGSSRYVLIVNIGYSISKRF